MTTQGRPKSRFLLFLVVALALFALFLPRYFTQRAEQAKIVKEANATAVPSYQVLRMKAQTKEISLLLPSYLEAWHTTPLLSRINGYLKEYLVDIGDRVKEGQLVAIIENPETDEQLARARAELESFRAKEEFARITALRWTELYRLNPEAVSKEEVDQTVYDYESARALAAAALDEVKRWEALDGYRYVYAPFDGIITTRPIDIGTLIIDGTSTNPTALFHLVQTGILRAFVDVPQSLFYLIKDGAPATARVWEFPTESFKGVVDRNASALNARARTMLTQVNIDNPTGALTSGLYATVEFRFKPEHPTYLIPVGALIIRSGPPFVAVISHGTVQLKPVKLGRDFGRTLEILDGLADDEEIIVNPSSRLDNGQKAKAVLISKEDEKLLMG